MKVLTLEFFYSLADDESPEFSAILFGVAIGDTRGEWRHDESLELIWL